MFQSLTFLSPAMHLDPFFPGDGLMFHYQMCFDYVVTTNIPVFSLGYKF